jgi:acetyl esterase/lipase
VNCIIVSFDYNLAPEHKIEQMVEECYKAYKVIVSNSASLFSKVFLIIEFKIRKLMVAGDSAGGHLALNITSSAIKDNFRRPDGVLLIYPGK